MLFYRTGGIGLENPFTLNVEITLPVRGRCENLAFDGNLLILISYNMAGLKKQGILYTNIDCEI